MLPRPASLPVWWTHASHRDVVRVCANRQVSIINLVLAVGLAVDYSAHVAHAFMITPGTRQQRVDVAIEEMGTAVIHGAFSTFLAVVCDRDEEPAPFHLIAPLRSSSVACGLRQAPFHKMAPLAAAATSGSWLPARCAAAEANARGLQQRHAAGT